MRHELFLALGVIGVSASVGCGHSLGVERMRELPIPSVSGREHPAWAQQRVIIRPFEDLRPSEYRYDYPTGSIPGVNLIHAGGRMEYPEHGGYLARDSKRPARMVGGLEEELPYLLARALPGDNATPTADLDPLAPHDSPDYVIEGRVLQATATQHGSFVLGMMSPIGVPMIFARQQLRVQVSLYRSAPRELVFQQVFDHDARMAEGLYYNHGAYGRLAREAVERTVTDMATELVSAVSRDQSTARPQAAEGRARG